MQKTLYQFQRLFVKDCTEEEAYQILCFLDPNKLKISEFFQIIDWIEQSAKKSNSFPMHVNIFGTGGDYPGDIFGKTLNISSLSATIASQFITVIKVGTRGVTARWGSADFFDSAAEISKKHQNYPFVFKPPSRFLSLASLGFKYSDNVILARKRLFEEDRLDLFKIVFPFANITNSYGQVNGISKRDYIEIFSSLAFYQYNSKILLIYNENGHDEILSGQNELIFHYQNKVIRDNLFIPRMSKTIESFFHERDTKIDQALAPWYLLENEKTRESFLEILCPNVASLVALDYWENFSTSLVNNLSIKIKQEFLMNYESNKAKYIH